MKYTVETWAPEYGTASDATQMEQSNDTVDVGVEVAAEEWAPIEPESTDPDGVVVFVDGVRRIDARVWIDDDGLARPGVCATVAAGATRCDGDSAVVVSPTIERGLFAAAREGVGPIVTRHGTYAFMPCAGDSPEDLYLGIHNRMTNLETSLEIGDDADVLVFDGPLRGRNSAKGVGFVKTHAVQYLPDEQQRIVGKMAAGERSPVFLIGGGGFSRWSWYLRLPGPISQPLSGVVRCELPALGTAEDAAGRADLVSAMLPRFASEPHKDPRAPQNLYPIAGLENELRRRLGDQYVLERALRVAAG